MAFVASWQESPVYGIATEVYDSYSRKKNWAEKLSVPALLLPLNSPCLINALYWEVPGFGEIWLEADNHGKGFMLSQTGEVLVLNLNYELARTKYRKLKERYEALDGKYKFSAGVSKGMQEAANFLHRAAAAQEDRKRAAFSDKSLYHSLRIGEMLELEKARKDIELNRKGMATLKLTNEKGEPVADVLIEYQQQSHDFLFGVGASALDAQEIALLKKTGINYSSFVAGWQFIELQLTKFSQEGFRAIDDYFQIL